MATKKETALAPPDSELEGLDVPALQAIMRELGEKREELRQESLRVKGHLDRELLREQAVAKLTDAEAQTLGLTPGQVAVEGGEL